MTELRYFTEAEAQALADRTVRARKALPGIPAGTRGRVVQANPLGNGWTVAVEFDTRKRPVVGWLSRDEYERWIEEMEP